MRSKKAKALRRIARDAVHKKEGQPDSVLVRTKSGQILNIGATRVYRMLKKGMR